MDNHTHINGQEVAVIGISGRFPGASDVRQYWDNISSGKESITFASDAELLALGVDKKYLSDKKYIKAKGGLLDNWDRFDAAFFGYTPSEAALMDPQTRIFLECAWSAVEDAGYSVDHIHQQVGVYAGAGSHYNWEIHSLQSDRSREAGILAASCLVDKDLMCTRVSHKLNFKGPSLTVQATCATSLVAVHIGCQALIDGECDMALAGGVSVYTQDKVGYLDQGDSYFSSDGHLRAFDAKASGTISGEGVGVVVLKLLEDALRDNDHIYAVVKGTAVNNDGQHKANYSAPSVGGQKRVIEQALAVAQVPAESIRYVECHGTGTLLGDPIEVEALKQAFEGVNKGSCALGSVKSNIGHLNGAAGIAGFIKTVLALEKRVLPPSINFSTPNPAIDFDNSPFFVNTRLTEWKEAQYPLRAGVSAFGIGGNNAHAILEQAPSIEARLSTDRSHQLLCISARTQRSLAAYVSRLAEAVKQDRSNELEDIAFAFNSGRKHFNHRVGITGETKDEIYEKLTALRDNKFRVISDEQTQRPAVFMFSGQGSEYVDMGLGLYNSEPDFKKHLDACLEILEGLMGEDIHTVLYPSAGATSGLGRINDPLYAGPVKFSFEYALARTMMSWGIIPGAMIGHSLGEYVCACISGVMALKDALALVVLRNRLMDRTEEGAMMGVPLAENEVLEFLGDQVALAAVNTPGNSILSGRKERLDDIAAELREKKGVDSIRFNVKRAGHSMLMESILEEFESAVSNVSLSAPQIPYISGTSGSWITDEEATDAGYYARHIRNTIRFSDGLAELLKLDQAVFIQVGADRGPVVFVRNQPRFSSNNLALNLVRHRKQEISDERFFVEALAGLWESGISVDWDGYYANSSHRRVSLPTYPFEGQTYPLIKHAVKSGGASLNLTTLTDNFMQGNQLYTPRWHQKDHAPRVLAQKEQKVVVIAMTPGGLGAYLAQKMTREGHTVIELHSGGAYAHPSKNIFSIRPDAKADYFKAIEVIKEGYGGMPHIVHCLSFGIEEQIEAKDRTERLLNHGIYSLLYMVQALGYHDVNGAIHIDVITSNAQEVVGSELTCPEKAALTGAINVIEAEYSNISCRIIDVDLGSLGNEDRPGMYHRILQEVESPPEENLVALRGRFRWIKTFETTRLPTDQEMKANPTPIRAGGVYIIIGGLGRIGLHISHFLAKKPDVKIALLQRTAIPDKGRWNSFLETSDEHDGIGVKIRALIALEEAGANVMPVSADISDPDQLEAAVLKIKQSYGRVNGVFNCAMDPGGGLIQQREKKEIEAVFGSKVQGTLTLDRLLQDQDLDFFVLFSSLSAVLPVMGKIDYCSANAFLDAFAHHPGNRERIRYMSVNWNYWEGTPLDDSPETAAIIQKNSVSVEEGIDILSHLLEDPRPQVLVSSQNPLNYAQELKATSMAHYAGTSLAAEAVDDLIEDYRKLVPYLAPRTPTERSLVNIWKNFFGYRKIGVADDFFQLGGDSLKALHIIPKVNDEFEKNITIANFYRYPTVADMAAFINSGKTNAYKVLNRLSKNTAGKQGSLICLPYAAGSSSTYMEFAQAMEQINPEVCVYAVNYPGNELDGSSRDQKDFEKIITEAIEIIKKEVKPPITVYGHCVGSYLALDLCARLEREDVKVQFLGIGGILNRPVLDVNELLNFDEQRMSEVYRKLGTFKGRDEDLPRSEYDGITENFKLDGFRISKYIIRRHEEGFVPRIHAPIVNLISDTDETTQGYAEDYKRWKDYSDTVRLVEVGGGGHFFINEKARNTAEIIDGLMQTNASRDCCLGKPFCESPCFARQRSF